MEQVRARSHDFDSSFELEVLTIRSSGAVLYPLEVSVDICRAISLPDLSELPSFVLSMQKAPAGAHYSDACADHIGCRQTMPMWSYQPGPGVAAFRPLRLTAFGLSCGLCFSWLQNDPRDQ